MPDSSSIRVVTASRGWKRRCLVSVLLTIALAQPAASQIPLLPKQKDSTPPPPAQVADPLGRSTPRGTITSFNEAVHRGDLAGATMYLQLTPSRRARADTLARDLSELMELYLSQPVATISASPDGARDDALAPDRERVGPLVIGDQRIDIGLVRVADSLQGPIWLISSETLAQVPALHSSITATWIERLMHPALVRRHLFGASLAQWIALAGSLALPWLLFSAFAGVFIAIARRRIDDPLRRRWVDHWHAELHRPVIAVLSLMAHLWATQFMGLALTFRLRYGRIALVVLVAAVAWLIRRLLGVSFERARSLIPGSTYSDTRSLMLLFERLIKAFVVVVAVVMVLTLLGVDTKTALAGVGIGGIAIALGAQKTVENLLGGIFLLSDKALAVGDTCTIGNRMGVVEDITLRSVRLRTLEQTLLSIPAGTLSQSNVENLSARGKILIQSRLRLRYGTSAAQVRSILGQLSTALSEHPKLEKGTSRARLVEFSERAIEVELFAFVLTTNAEEFLVVREDVLLEAATIVESSGAGFAQPTQFVYMERETGLDAPGRADVARRFDAEVPVAPGRSREDARRQP
jgi:MscS family membrane protein